MGAKTPAIRVPREVNPDSQTTRIQEVVPSLSGQKKKGAAGKRARTSRMIRTLRTLGYRVEPLGNPA
jgi:hypothetical protein